MKKWIIALVLVLVLGVGVAYAASVWPESVTRWVDEECSLVCYEWADGSGDCYPCVSCISTIVETPDPSETPPPTETPPPPTPPTEEPTEKPKCNRGLGNGSENCDPGNSGGKPGAAGEDNE